jgi:hypothetical protein
MRYLLYKASGLKTGFQLQVYQSYSFFIRVIGKGTVFNHINSAQRLPEKKPSC